AEQVSLPDGRSETALVPRVYLLPRSGELSPTGGLMGGLMGGLVGGLMSAQQLRLNLSGELLSGGTLAGRELVHIDAQGVHSSGLIAASHGSVVVQAQEDIHIAGGELHARDALVLQAGRDLSVASTTRSTATQA